MEIEKQRCQFCGRPAKYFAFAAFVCDREECMENARLERGGPGGHIKRKVEGKSIAQILDEEW
jgi:hypothetical protein